MASTPDYAIMSAPRISAAGFAAILAAAHSPATAEAAAEYSAFVAAGVDPAVGLAMFRKESSFGTAGRATTNRSWGNIRGGTGYPTDSGGFRAYPSWTVGALDCARLLAVYGRNQIRTGVKTDTVQTLPYVWAPASDGNAPDAYGDQLAAWVGEYAARYPSGGGAGPIAGTATSTGANLVTAASAVTKPTLADLLGLDPATKLTPKNYKDIETRILALEGAGKLDHNATQNLLNYIGGVAVGAAHGGPTITLGDIIVDTTTGRPMTWLDDLISALGGAATNAMTNAILLSAVLGIVVLGLYLLVKDA